VSSPNQQASHFTSPGRAKKRRPTNVIAASRIRTARRQRPAFHLCSKQATLSYLQLKCRTSEDYKRQHAPFPLGQSAENNNGWSYTSTPLYAFMAVYGKLTIFYHTISEKLRPITAAPGYDSKPALSSSYSHKKYLIRSSSFHVSSVRSQVRFYTSFFQSPKLFTCTVHLRLGYPKNTR
jgi:hypothetical protein